MYVGEIGLRILGIDPGYAILGYGVIDTHGTKNTVVDYGVIETHAKEPFPERLEKLYSGTKELIRLYQPDTAVFEELFFYRNTTTAIAVGAGRGTGRQAQDDERDDRKFLHCPFTLHPFTPSATSR